MSRGPRFLPILLVVVGGALAVRGLVGVQALPQMFDGARALAEDVAQSAQPAKPKAKAAANSDPVNALLAKPPVPPRAALNQPAAAPPPVCAPTPAELARQAGMSPNELQVLQSLGSRRTQLDAREHGLDTQLQLLSAAESKVDAKLKLLTGLKGDIQGLLGQADTQKQAEIGRLVTVYENMQPAAAAARLAMLDDSVRLPILAKMNVRKMPPILAAMSATDAKTITEKLADRLTAADQARQAIASATGPAPQPASAPASQAAPAPGAKKG